MSLTMTFAPLAASSLLIASPRPEPPPVTIATFPSKSDILVNSLPVVAHAWQSHRPDAAVEGWVPATEPQDLNSILVGATAGREGRTPAVRGRTPRVVARPGGAAAVGAGR